PISAPHSILAVTSMSAIILDKGSVEIPIYSGFDRSIKFLLFSSAAAETSKLRSAGGAIGSDRRNRIVIRALDAVSREIHDADRATLKEQSCCGITYVGLQHADVVE